MKKVLLVASLLVASTAFAATPPSNAKYNGNCAYGLTMGKSVPTDCSVSWTDSTSKETYCFLNEQNKSEWAKNTATNEAKADAEFAKLNAMKTSETASKNAMNQATEAMNQANQAMNQANQAVNQAQAAMPK